MKSGLAVILLLAAASVLTHFLLADNGYVLINFRGYAVEMSVPVLVFLLALIYLGVRLLLGVWRAPRELGAAAARARSRRAGRKVAQGFAALSDGKIARGERLLTRGAGDSDAPLLGYLAAARAAQMNGDQERRDGWLRMAYEQGSGTNNAVLLTQAELQLEDGQYEQALASLNRVRESRPNHPQALRLLARLRHVRKEWAELADLLPALRRTRNISSAQLDDWTTAAYCGLLDETDIDVGRIEAHWQVVPRHLRREAALVRARIRALLRAGASEAVESEVRKALKASWDEDLVLLFR